MSLSTPHSLIAPPGPSAAAADWLSKVWQQDALALCPTLAKSSIDMIYIDPPYFTKRLHQGVARPAAAAADAEVPAEVSDNLTFNDRWKGGRAAYLAWLEARLRVMRPLLKPTGVLLLHLDWHVVHYAKVLCDQIFGDDAMINELIWHYQTGGAGKGRFSRKHDTILAYAAGPTPYFNGRAIAIPRGAGAMKRARCATGARIRADDTHKNPDDVLIVPALNPMASERTGYPTQKPMALLEKLILAWCPPGGIVADFFCGSGTTLITAATLKRGIVGCDVNPAAVALTRARLARWVNSENPSGMPGV